LIFAPAIASTAPTSAGLLQLGQLGAVQGTSVAMAAPLPQLPVGRVEAGERAKAGVAGGGHLNPSPKAWIPLIEGLLACLISAISAAGGNQNRA